METFYDVLSDIYGIILDHISQDILMSLIGSVIGYLIRRFLPNVFGDLSTEATLPPRQSPFPSTPTPHGVSGGSTEFRDSTYSYRPPSRGVDDASLLGDAGERIDKGYDNTDIDNNTSSDDGSSGDGGIVNVTFGDGYTVRFETSAADIPFVYRVLKESIRNGGVLKHLVDYIIMLRTQYDQCHRELRHWQERYAELSSHYQEVVRRRDT